MSLCEPWATTADLCSPCNDYAFDSSDMDSNLLAASEILYQLSGQQFPGECEETIRPCTRQSFNIWKDSPHFWSTVRYYRAGFSVCGCGDTDTCGCSSLSSIHLPRHPITSIDEVKLDGEVLTADVDYRIDDSSLVRLGGDPWPCCQDLSLPDTELDTLSITYTWGRPPPAIGVRAASILACELYMACDPEEFEGQCRLPRNIVQIARQGVTVLVSSTNELFTTTYGQPAKFGIWEIDMFLRAFNPYGRMSPSIVLSPDLPAKGRRTGTA